MTSIFVIIFAVIFPKALLAEEISLDMSEASIAETSNLVSNFQIGRLLPPLQVQGWDEDFVGDVKTRDLDLGDGSMGSFDMSTYSNFGSVQGQVIQLDTDKFPQGLQVTEFRLDTGWTISPVGRAPLIIQSLGDVIIDGRIDCSGSDGEKVDSLLSSTPKGGNGRCGGGDGGSGGTASQTPISGLSFDLNLTGGVGGPLANMAQGQGGGGGGAFGKWAAFGGRDSTDTDNGTGGDGLVDTGFLVAGGGAGGGGGSAYVALSLADSKGGGGGAGGGAIQIVAAGRVEINGELWAFGGNGGGDNTGLKAGGGGGGGGGSIAIFGATDVVLTSLVSAQRGIGGLTQFAAGGGASGNGGTGGQGRIWIVSGIDGLGATGSGFESPSTANVKIGQVKYISTDTLVLTTKVIDFWNSAPVIASIVATTGGDGDSVIEVASGNTADFDPTNRWQTIDQVTHQTHDRFLRLKVSIDNSCANCDRSPEYVEKIKINYTPFQRQNFDFQGGCGQVLQNPPGQGPLRSLIYLLLLLLPLVIWQLSRTGPKSRRPA